MNKFEWYRFSENNESVCVNCEYVNLGLNVLDHHMSVCPNCGVECIWFDMGFGKGVQIIPENAPKEMRLFILWSQSNLDEIEFVELVVAFEALGKGAG